MHHKKSGDRRDNYLDTHRYTSHMFKTWGTFSDLMVTSIESQNGQNLTSAQSNAHIDHPDEPIGEGGLRQ
jgi:hypothetical protein